MSTATEVLVIIVSSLLSLFLIFGIIVLVLFMKLIKEIKRVVIKAEQLAESASHVGDILQNARGKWTIIKLVNNLIKFVSKH